MTDNRFIDPKLTFKSIDVYYHRRSIFEFIKVELTNQKGKLLDVGCGKMPYREFIKENSNLDSYTGLDIEEALIYDDSVKPDYYWDGITMPFEDSSFDSVLSTEVLEHIQDPTYYLNEIFRVLKPNGKFFITVPFLWPLHEVPNDCYRYTPYSLDKMLTTFGFKKLKLNSLGGWNASIAQLYGLWLKRSGLRKRYSLLLYYISRPIINILFRSDKPKFGNSKMLTGLSAVYTKN